MYKYLVSFKSDVYTIPLFESSGSSAHVCLSVTIEGDKGASVCDLNAMDIDLRERCYTRKLYLLFVHLIPV